MSIELNFRYFQVEIEAFIFNLVDGKFRQSFEFLLRPFVGCYFWFAGGWRLEYFALHKTKLIHQFTKLKMFVFFSNNCQDISRMFPYFKFSSLDNCVLYVWHSFSFSLGAWIPKQYCGWKNLANENIVLYMGPFLIVFLLSLRRFWYFPWHVSFYKFWYYKCQKMISRVEVERGIENLTFPKIIFIYFLLILHRKFNPSFNFNKDI